MSTNNKFVHHSDELILQFKFECTMDQGLADAATYVPERRCSVDSPDGSTFLREMAAMLKV